MVKKVKDKYIDFPTKSQVHSWIMGVLRRYFSIYSRARKQCLDKNKEVYFETTKKGTQRRRVKYKCAGCSQWYPSTKIQVDHKEEVIDPVVGFVDIDTVISRMWCGIQGLQCLCLACHKAKTNAVRKIRLQNRK